MGETVLVEEENIPRGLWRIVLIIQLGTSRDAEIRAATIRMSDGHEIRRPINQLFPLEIGENETAREGTKR